MADKLEIYGPFIEIVNQFRNQPLINCPNWISFELPHFKAWLNLLIFILPIPIHQIYKLGCRWYFPILRWTIFIFMMPFSPQIIPTCRPR